MTAQEGQLGSGASCPVGTDEPAVPEPWFRALAEGNGCRSAQGFYWSQPLPALEFASWWHRAERHELSLPNCP
jgi:hypothetical protein